MSVVILDSLPQEQAETQSRSVLSTIESDPSQLPRTHIF